MNEKPAFDHVAQVVPEIAAAVDWYVRTVPGTRILYQDESWAFLDAAGARLALIREGGHPGHLAWRVSESELQDLAARHGATIKPHRDRSRSFYLQDPAGHWIEFITFPPDYPYQTGS